MGEPLRSARAPTRTMVRSCATPRLASGYPLQPHFFVEAHTHTMVRSVRLYKKMARPLLSLSQGAPKARGIGGFAAFRSSYFVPRQCSSTRYGLRDTDYEIRTTRYRLRDTDYEIRTTRYGLRDTREAHHGATSATARTAEGGRDGSPKNTI